MRIACCFVILAALLSGCADRAVPAPGDVKVLRTYGWDAKVKDPQAEWNPAMYHVLAREKGGFAILRESAPENSFGSEERREMYNPVWLNERQFAFGPEQNVITVDGGRIVPPADGLTVVTLNPDRSIASKRLAKAGCRPRVWNDKVLAQVEDKIMLFDERGRAELFEEGFYAEPQRNGPGVCWQETPVFETDHWTAKPVLSRLFIRWRPGGALTEVPHAVAGRWTANGGVVALTLAREPRPGAAWWADGTKVIYIADAKSPPRAIAENMHELAPHPKLPLVAATANDGKLMLIDCAGRPQAELAPVGERPRWSFDGGRLMAEEPPRKDGNGKFLKVYVLKFARPTN